MRNANLYGWLFTFNPYTGYWYAAKREDYFKLFSNQEDDNILKSSDLEMLKYLIINFEGDKDKIEKMIKNQKNLKSEN